MQTSIETMNGIRTSFQRRSIAAVVSLFLILALPLSAHAQTAEDALRFTQRAPATGARMTGLAGAGVVGVADQTAFILNPAGLGFYTRSEFSAGLNLQSTTDEASYRMPAAGALLERDLNKTGIGNISYIYRVPTVKGSLVLGAAFNQVGTYDRNLAFEGDNGSSSISDSFLPYDDEYEIAYDKGIPFPRFFSATPELAYLGGAIEFLSEEVGTGNYPFYQAVDPTTTIRQRGSVIEEGRLNELNFGGAVEAVEGLMAGASINIAFGSYRFRTEFEETDAFNTNGPAQYQVFLPSDTLRGFSSLRYTERLATDLVGVNARFGVSSAVSPSVRLGLTLETPTYYNVTEDYERTLDTFFDQGGSLGHGGEPGDAGQGEFEYSITTPWRMGAGAAFAAVGLTLSADVEFVDWSQLRLNADTDRSYFADVNRDIRDRFRGVWNSRLGLEYNWEDLAVRGGVAFRPDPVRDPQLLQSGDELDRGRTFFSFGIGYKFANQLQLDLAWMQERFEDVYVPYARLDTTPPSVEENVTRNRFVLGLRYLF